MNYFKIVILQPMFWNRNNVSSKVTNTAISFKKSTLWLCTLFEDWVSTCNVDRNHTVQESTLPPYPHLSVYPHSCSGSILSLVRVSAYIRVTLMMCIQSMYCHCTTLLSAYVRVTLSVRGLPLPPCQSNSDRTCSLRRLPLYHTMWLDGTHYVYCQTYSDMEVGFIVVIHGQYIELLWQRSWVLVW